MANDKLESRLLDLTDRERRDYVEGLRQLSENIQTLVNGVEQSRLEDVMIPLLFITVDIREGGLLHRLVRLLIDNAEREGQRLTDAEELERAAKAVERGI